MGNQEAEDCEDRCHRMSCGKARTSLALAILLRNTLFRTFTAGNKTIEAGRDRLNLPGKIISSGIYSHGGWVGVHGVEKKNHWEGYIEWKESLLFQSNRIPVEGRQNDLMSGLIRCP